MANLQITRLILFIGLLVSPTKSLMGFELDGTKWLGAQTDYYVNMTGISATGIAWNTAFLTAMNAWTEQTVFDFTLVNENADPCLDNGLSSVDFSDEFCGSNFGNNVLAITVRRFEPQILGRPYIREADIIVNSNEEFDVFDGPLIQFGQTFAGLDFGRVALHELGHVIGLDHEETNDAIMAPNIGNLFELQEDDINGVNTLHDGLSNCTINSLNFGIINDALDSSDCTVSELAVGGTDDSFLDLYQFELEQTRQLVFNATAESLDTVLVLATTDLEYLDVQLPIADTCNSQLSANLDPGSYFIIVNTFESQQNFDCNVFGNYQLRASFSSDAEPSLGTATSLSSTNNSAVFSGGITADNGASYTNVFSPTDSLDISAQITIDAQHVGQAGFLVVAALIDDQVLMLNDQGEFVDVTASPLPAVQFVSKTLGSTENLTIATDLIPADLGIQEIEADIVVGYGLQSDPNDIFYHQTPLNLTVLP